MPLAPAFTTRSIAEMDVAREKGTLSKPWSLTSSNFTPVSPFIETW